jgi:hypothetical protein
VRDERELDERSVAVSAATSPTTSAFAFLMALRQTATVQPRGHALRPLPR